MQIINKDERSGFKTCFNYGLRILTYFMHIGFLETCKHFQLQPRGLLIDKEPFIKFENKELTAIWVDTIESTQRQLLDTLIVGIHGKLLDYEICFWRDLKKTQEETEEESFNDWWVKFFLYFEKQEKIWCRKRKRS